MTEKKQVKLRLPEEKIEELKAQAEKEHRSINNLLEKIIYEYLETNKQ